MSLLLPQNPELREMLDIEALARKEVVLFRDALASAKRFFSDKANQKAVKFLTFQVMRADDSIELLRVGPKGGHQTLWKFGKFHA